MRLALALVFLLLGGCVCERVPKWEYPWEKPLARGKANAIGERVRWVEGHWLLVGREQLYVPSHWERAEPAILVWLETECHRRGRFWVYTPGLWRRADP